MRLRLREPVNALTHLLGAILSVIGLVMLIVAAIEHGSARHIVAVSIFGASLVIMYGVSALYHASTLSERGLGHFQRIDHVMIYVLIAGSYTPICLVVLRGRLGIVLLVTVWALAALGVFQKIFWMHAPRWLSTALYLGMGWIAVLIARPLIAAASPGFFFWLLAGGIAYSLGAVVYAKKWPRGARKIFGSHEIWHLFVMAGSFAHYWAILAYVAKAAKAS
ncbi:MAG: hemolysin III family protein [Gemmatimonadota bacterium]|nr:hemolysin III family protein [Gemmatimonadota bacterium]